MPEKRTSGLLFTPIWQRNKDIKVLKQFAVNNLGIAFIPDMTAVNEVKNKTLKKLDWKGNSFPIYSQVFVHKDKHIGKAISSLVDIIKSYDNNN